jgi:Uma2 family endonuclease
MAATTLLTSDQFLALPEEIGMQVSGCDAFAPDVCVVSRDRLSGVGGIFHGADLSVRLAGGSKSVWIVCPEARAIMGHTSNSVREVKDNQSIEDPLLPGFSSPVSAFFELP